MASRLADAHIDAQARLRRIVAATVRGIWADLPGYDRENLDEWLSGVVPVVETGQRSAAILADSYIARMSGQLPAGLDLDEIVNGTRAGIATDEVYSRPFVTLWSGLGAGSTFEAASSAALARATGTAAMDMQLAMRAAAGQTQRALSIPGFVRVADAGACAFCSEVDGAYLKDADAMPLHNHCGCGVEPQEIERESTPPPRTVAVHEHGELGPVLADPSHDFATAAQALA